MKNEKALYQRASFSKYQGASFSEYQRAFFQNINGYLFQKLRSGERRDIFDFMYRVYRFADINIGVNFTYDFIDRQCEKYLSDGLPEHIITITSEKIDYERSLNGENGAGFPDGYFESLAFHREFVTWAVDKQVLLMHGSTIAFDGKAYMYTAPSGTGKSTHSHICSKVFGDRVFYINDDKPFLPIYRKLLMNAYKSFQYSSKRTCSVMPAMRIVYFFFE